MHLAVNIYCRWSLKDLSYFFWSDYICLATDNTSNGVYLNMMKKTFDITNPIETLNCFHQIYFIYCIVLQENIIRFLIYLHKRLKIFLIVHTVCLYELVKDVKSHLWHISIVKYDTAILSILQMSIPFLFWQYQKWQDSNIR